MAAKSNPSEDTSNREIVIARVFDAPRELVFEAWTESGHVDHWFGPKGFVTKTRKMDVRAGGSWHYIMHGPNGIDYDNLINYEEVVRPERLVYMLGSTELPDQFHVTVTFVEEGKKTRLTMRMLFPTAAIRDKVVKEVGAIEGGNQTLDRLAAYLATIS